MISSIRSARMPGVPPPCIRSGRTRLASVSLLRLHGTPGVIDEPGAAPVPGPMHGVGPGRPGRWAQGSCRVRRGRGRADRRRAPRRSAAGPHRRSCARSGTGSRSWRPAARSARRPPAREPEEGALRAEVGEPAGRDTGARGGEQRHHDRGRRRAAAARGRARRPRRPPRPPSRRPAPAARCPVARIARAAEATVAISPYIRSSGARVAAQLEDEGEQHPDAEGAEDRGGRVLPAGGEQRHVGDERRRRRRARCPAGPATCRSAGTSRPR